MKRYLFVFSLLWLVGIIGCSEDDSNKSTGPSETGTVKGHVYLTGSTNPVSGVQIGCAGKYATSASDGAYQLNNVSVGDQTLTATKPDYENFTTTVHVTTGSVTFNINMTSSITTTNLHGTVVNAATSAPIQGASISIAGMSEQTDFSGHYQFPNVPQGQRPLTVMHSQYHQFASTVYLYTTDKEYNIGMDFGPPVVSNISLADSCRDAAWDHYWHFSLSAQISELRTIHRVYIAESQPHWTADLRLVSGTDQYHIDTTHWDYYNGTCKLPDSLVATDSDSFRTAVWLSYPGHP